MARILLLQLDGSFPNIALMRISHFHKERGDFVRLKVAGNLAAVKRAGPEDYDRVYASLLFSRTRPLAENVLTYCKDVIVGGSGWDDIPHGQDTLISLQARRSHAKVTRLEDYGIASNSPYDYSIYPTFEPSIGFSQRGCRMGCGFCDVPIREGSIVPFQSIEQIYRGAPYPRKLILWDNDTFGNPGWKSVFRSILDGGFKVSFNQGINARLMNEENAEWLANLPCYKSDFTVRRWYTAWDNRRDEATLFRGLKWLTKYGVKPDNIMVYMLIGYWSGETAEDREYRRWRLREFGARPYPMPYIKTKELVGFQRWVMGAYDKRFSWAEWEEAGYRPENLGKVAV